MKFTFIAVSVAAMLFLGSCRTENSTQELASKYIAAENDAWNTGNLADLEAVEDPDVVYHMPGLELKGRTAHTDYIIKGRPTVLNLKQNWKYLSGEGNHFALAYASSAIVKANDTTPSMSASNDFLFVVRASNGKVAEVWMNGTTTTKPVAKD
jgi:hypothetical protein